MAQDVDCPAMLRLLAHRTRLEVVRALLDDGPLHVWEINERVAIEPTLLSHHLRALREAGLVDADRDGKAVLYRLADGLRARDGRSIDLACCVLRFPPGGGRAGGRAGARARP